MALSKLASHVVGVADLEVGAVINTHTPALQEKLAAKLHACLRENFLRNAANLTLPKRRQHAMLALRKLVADQVNRATDVRLNLALSAFRTAMSANVIYVFGDSSSDDEDGNAVDDSSQLPFMRHHDDAIEAAIRLRNLQSNEQWAALNACEAIQAEWLAGLNAGDRNPAEVEASRSRAESTLKGWVSELPPGAFVQVEQFFYSMAFGGVEHDALPIRVADDLGVDELRRIAEAHWEFGSAMRFFDDVAIEGKPLERRKAQLAWTRYAAHGLCFKVLGAWLRSASIEEAQGTCAICYRHLATKTRCAEHSTATHETREGRLGRVVRPKYLAKVRELSVQPEVKSSLDAWIRPERLIRPEIRYAVEKGMKVKGSVLDRCMLLADQLNRLEHVFTAERQSDARTLFRQIVDVATEYATDRDSLVLSASTRDKRGQRAGLADRAIELLSLKGFFSAWFGSIPDLVLQTRVKAFGFDSRHPCVRGPLVPNGLAAHLLRQRAWEEAFQEVWLRKNPTKEMVIKAKETAGSVRAAALALGISVAKLYKIKDGPDDPSRLRNRI